MGKPDPTSKKITQTFKLLDQNRDGKISFKEIKLVLGKLQRIINGEFDKEYEAIQYKEV